MTNPNSPPTNTGDFVFPNDDPDPAHTADADEPETQLKLTRRRAVAGLATIVLGSAGAGAGTLALWSDTRDQGVSFDSGSLGFVVGQTQTLGLNVSDLKPTDAGTGAVDLRKATTSTVNGNLSISIANFTSGEGGTPSWEADTDTGNGGELDDQLELQIWLGLGSDSDTTFDGGTDIGLHSDGTTTTTNKGGFEPATNYQGTDWGEVVTNFSGPATFHVDYQFPDQAGNDNAHSDTLSMDFRFTLAQQT